MLNWPTEYAYSTFCIECDFSQCCLSVTADNSSSKPLVSVIRHLWSAIALSKIECNVFHQVFLVHIWHHRWKDIKCPYIFWNGISHLTDNHHNAYLHSNNSQCFTMSSWIQTDSPDVGLGISLVSRHVGTTCNDLYMLLFHEYVLVSVYIQ